jgi:hypothetical protein
MATYHYTFDGPKLHITCSDSQQEHVDEKRIPEDSNHHWIQQLIDSDLSKQWRRKLGRDLATMFLLKPANKHSMHPIVFPSSHLSLTTASVDYSLAEFPQSYKLYYHIKGLNHEIERTDAYLFSMWIPLQSHMHCQLYLHAGDHHKFRSPAEFLPHAAWLIAGMPPGSCRCKYCSPGRGEKYQTGLVNELKDGYEAEMNNRRVEEYQAQRAGKIYVPNNQPLVKLFLNTHNNPMDTPA